MMARRPPAPKATQRYDEHVFNPVPNANDWRGEQTTDCRHCPFPKANAVHIQGELLPPRPPEDESDRWIGEG